MKVLLRFEHLSGADSESFHQPMKATDGNCHVVAVPLIT